MKFDEKKAEEIILKFNLSKNTIKVWKNRNSIPDKYFNEFYDFSEKAKTNADMILTERIINMSKLNILNFTTIMQLCFINPFKIYDVQKNKTFFTKQELLRFKKEINILKIFIVKSVEYNNIETVKNLFADKRLKYNIVMKDDMTLNEIKSVVYQVQKHAEIDKHLFDKLKNAYIKAAIRLSL